MNKLNYFKEGLERSLLMLDKEEAERILLEAAQQDTPIEIASHLITSALQNIGDDWEEGKLALSQVYMSGIICEELIDKMLPPLSPERVSQPKMAIEEATAQVRIAIEIAAPGGGFILSNNHGEIPFQVTDEVLMAISEAVLTYGKYPIS